MSMTTRPPIQIPTPVRRGPRAAAAILTSTLALTTALAAGPPSPEPPEANAPALAVISRSVAQDQGGWHVDYRLRYRGASGMIVTPTEVLVKLEGWVSNSRVPAHALPRLSSLVVSGPAGLTGTTDVLPAADESQRCRERATVQVWTDDDPAGPPPPPGEARGPMPTPSQRQHGDRPPASAERRPRGNGPAPAPP